jgi:flagellar basal-body rod protein FlgB
MSEVFDLLEGGSMSNLAVGALTFALDGLNVQQNVIANNVSNADTPGFTASQVSFENSLSQALQAGTPAATAAVSVAASAAPAASNGNNVSLNTELVNLENSTLNYQADSNLLTDQFKLLAGSMGGSF